MDEFVFEDEESDDEESTVDGRARFGRRVTQSGGILFFVGLLLTVAGASQMARIGKAYVSAIWGVSHRAGLLIVLAGASLALLGYRIPWIGRIVRQNPTASLKGGRSMDSDEPTGNAAHDSLMPVLPLFGVSVAAAAVLSGFVWFLPALESTLLSVLLTVMIPLATLVVLVYGTSWQRTYAIGMAVASFAIFWMNVGIMLRLLQFGWSGMTSVAFRARQAGTLGPTLALLVGFPVLGSAAVVLRVMLLTMNRMCLRLVKTSGNSVSESTCSQSDKKGTGA